MPPKKRGGGAQAAPQAAKKRKRAVGDGQTPGPGVKKTKPTPVPSPRPSTKATTSTKKQGNSRVVVRQASSAPLPVINQPPIQALAVFVFGNGDNGELGLGPAVQEATSPCLNPSLDPDRPSALRVVQLRCGGMHTVALTANNEIVTWGVNDDGALGRNTDWQGQQLREVDDDDSDEEGELNPLESTPTAVPASSFDPGTKFVQVAAGDSCTLALTDTGLVHGWGTFTNDKGKKRFGYDVAGKAIEMQATPTLIRGLHSITQIVCGANHAMALDAKGVIWTWGCGDKNQLGRRPTGRRFTDPLQPHPIGIRNIKHIASGEYHSLAVDKEDNVWAWGLNSFGEAGYAKGAGGDSALTPHPMKIPGLRGQRVVCLDGGSHHSAAVTADGRCLVWGQLNCGQLGIRFTADQLRDTGLVRRDERDKPRICLRPAEVLPAEEVAFVACGTDHTIFVTAEGTAYATGFNSGGQLGLGNEDDVDVAEPIKGAAAKNWSFTWAGAGGQFSVLAAPKPVKDS